MSLNGRYRGYAMVAGALVVSACADNSTAPKSLISSLGSGSAHSLNSSSLHSNNTQYRAQTLPHQSNRSGSATLTSRALLGKNGQTILEVTTGQLGATSAPGSIRKLQEKFLAPSKVLMATKNYNGLTGPVQTITLPGLMPHSWIQTQGNVDGIDGKRTDVVTITERVNKRPDLAITAVNAPDKAKPDQDIIVTADVRELNGDVGAYDDCVLYVDGTEAARINHQWIADGDLVNCAFRTSIAAVGTHTLEVRSQNVNPSDWDLSNNSRTASIEIVNPEVRLNGNFNAYDYDYDYKDFYDYKISYTDGRVYQDFYDYTNKQRSSNANFYAYSYDQTGGGNITSADMSFTSGGVVFGSISAANLNGGNCAYQYNDNGNTWLNMCTYSGYTYAQGGTNGGRAVYYSYRFSYDSYNYGYYYSDGPYSSEQTWGNGQPFAGNDVSFDFRATTSSGTTFLAGSSLTLGDWNDYYYYNYNQPLVCEDYDYTDYYYNYYGYTYHYCREYHYMQRQRSGYSYF